jgi:YggT family protein
MDLGFFFFIVAQLLGIYQFILIIRILLTWIPNIDPYNPLVQALRAITDPILEPMRGIIPPMGGFDLSPLLAFLLIAILRQTFLALA